MDYPLALSGSRRSFLKAVGALGITVSTWPGLSASVLGQTATASKQALKFPGPWQFLLPKRAIILVNDQQLRDLRDLDKEVDLSLTATPDVTTLRKICESARAQGARTLILAFDEFWSQYRKGQGGKPRELMPDTAEYIELLGALSKTLKTYGLGFELSLLSPLEVGRGYARTTGESGRWVQYREGYRDPATGHYTVSLWEQHQWTNNKGSINLSRSGIRVFAFREARVGGTDFYAVEPTAIRELKLAPEVALDTTAQPGTTARRLRIQGTGETDMGPLDRVLAVVSYTTPEMDYFSPRALPFLQDLTRQYHAAGIPLNGLYADEMHIQQDWGYFSHHDEGQFTFRYLTQTMASRFAELYGSEYADLEKYLVYFSYAQHSFMPNLEARLPAQHVFGSSDDQIQQAALLRRRYFDLLERTVVKLFADAKEFAERTYGHELESRAHATWAQSPTIDAWENGNLELAPRQYEYTPDFLWSNTVQQAAAACSDYFEWNAFLTGGGNDHAEGGWLDRDYYGIALACSTGILNKTPYAYAAAWGMPGEVHRRHQAVCDAFGASAQPWFQAVQDSQHRDVDVLMLYPMSLVAAEERFGSWMVQYAYANYITPRKLLEHGRILDSGHIEIAGRRFGTLAVLFEPLPPAGLLAFLTQFVSQGGKLIWSGPPPRLDLSGAPVFEAWKELFGIRSVETGAAGRFAGGWQVTFSGPLERIPVQPILTDFLVDRIYPVEPHDGITTLARLGERIIGTHKAHKGRGVAVFLGFRPRDDQSASLGYEMRTWFEILRALNAYPATRDSSPENDNPTVISRTSPYVACSFPNGTIAIAPHFCRYIERWPGGFHRDQKQDDEILRRYPLPSPQLELKDFRVAGHKMDYSGIYTVAFRIKESFLTAFAGHQCADITIDGEKRVFADKPLALLAWAPVLPERRIDGGAVMELWADGDAAVRIPLPPGITAGKLHFQGATLESLGPEVPSSCVEGILSFKAEATWPQKHLYFTALS